MKINLHCTTQIGAIGKERSSRFCEARPSIEIANHYSGCGDTGSSPTPNGKCGKLVSKLQKSKGPVLGLKTGRPVRLVENDPSSYGTPFLVEWSYS